MFVAQGAHSGFARHHHERITRYLSLDAAGKAIRRGLPLRILSALTSCVSVRPTLSGLTSHPETCAAKGVSLLVPVGIEVFPPSADVASSIASVLQRTNFRQM